MNTLTPKEVIAIQMALENFIEDTTTMRKSQVPFNVEAIAMMKEVYETATSALKKIQINYGFAVQLDTYKGGDEKEVLTKQS